MNLTINIETIGIESIISYKIKPLRDYNKGGFYLIRNKINNKCYVGKSVDYMARLKQHTFKSSSKSDIDRALNLGLHNFEYYILGKYKDIGISYFNKKAETKIEHLLIEMFKSMQPNGYNNRYYGHL